MEIDIIYCLVKLINMSIAAVWVAIAVMLLRLSVFRIPKNVRCLLWALVGIRLVLPFSFESPLSFIPSADTINVSTARQVSVGESIATVTGTAEGGVLPSELVSTVTDATADFNILLIGLFMFVWLFGMAVMAVYGIVSYIRLRRRLAVSAPTEDGYYLCDGIETAFIFGILAPKIYIPSHVEAGFIPHILAHERAHLKRGDHVWKFVGFIILSVHWFNPVVWVSYILFSRDMELACDERVVKKLAADEKKEYSHALLSVSSGRRMMNVCPVAFGEGNVGSRVKAVLNYRKPRFYIIILSVLVCVSGCVVFLTDPLSHRLSDVTGELSTEDISSALISNGRMEYEVIDDLQLEKLLETVSHVKISRKEASSSRGEDREKTNQIILRDASGNDVRMICFNEDCDLVWVDDTVKPSYSYNVYSDNIYDLFSPGVVKWAYNPMLSATFHYFFSFRIPYDSYKDVTVSCMAGEVWDLENLGNQTRGKEITVSDSKYIHWTPGGDIEAGERAAKKCELKFSITLDNGDVTEGVVEIEPLFGDFAWEYDSPVYTARIDPKYYLGFVQNGMSDVGIAMMH